MKLTVTDKLTLNKIRISDKLSVSGGDKLKITDENIDGGKPFDWGRVSGIMRSSGTFTRRSFMKKLSAAVCA